VIALNENDTVRIKKNNVVGVIIDIYEVGGVTHYSVEANEKTVEAEGGYGKEYPIFDCLAEEIEYLD
jgi:hypothetical protein